MTGPDVRLLDAQQQLLDRQIVDDNGRMVAKVDDLEIAAHDDGTLEVTGILTGPAALGPRVGGAIGAVAVAAWSRLSGRGPDEPRRIGLTLVEQMTTVVTLRVSRRDLDVDGFEAWAREQVIEAIPGAGEADDVHERPPRPVDHGPPPADRHRLTDLIGMTTLFSDGRDGYDVLDVVLRHEQDDRHRLTVDGLVVGRRRPGMLFGYHRHPQQGPWIVRTAVRAWHRHIGALTWRDVERVDWQAGVVRLAVSDTRPASAE